MGNVEQSDQQKRLTRIWLYLRSNPGAVTRDIAEDLSFSSTENGLRSLRNWLNRLEKQGRAYVDEKDYWYATEDSQSLFELDVSLEEIGMAELGMRLLTQLQTHHSLIAQSLLDKFAAALGNERAAYINRSLGREIGQLQPNIAQEDHLRSVLQAWLNRHTLHLTYRTSRDQTIETDFQIYWVEPSLATQGIYLIGHSSHVQARRTYKLQRIQSITDTKIRYSIPSEFMTPEFLRHSWHIFYGEETTTVVARFSAAVAHEITETIWHPSQETTPDPELAGWLRWQVQIADTRDLLRWLRGWGADCEVLEPAGLRTQVQSDAQRTLGRYGSIDLEKPAYYAHSLQNKNQKNWQYLRDHLNNTAQLAAQFAAPTGLSELARIAAQLHDLGKYSDKFQARLKGSKQRVDHSTAGAQFIRQLFNKTPSEQLLATLLAYCIAGHHTGLPDYGSQADVAGDGTLLARVDPAKTKVADYSAYTTEINTALLQLPTKLSIRTQQKFPGFSWAFLTRMVFSALVDADFQDTETFMNQAPKSRGNYASIDTLCDKLNTYLTQFANPTNRINHKRTETLNTCVHSATLPKGLFTLTIPTGGGKTLASMAFALNHAVKHGLERIIYVIPFTSIIEQNAGIFKKIFGEHNVLEHHANFDWQAAQQSVEEDQTDAVTKLKLASENWEIPIVVTTNVQFFESLFANKTSRCRKLHNIAKSVIVFDEAQMLPRDYMLPCMLAIKELTLNYGCSTVFCTATQPELYRFFQNTTFTELAPDVPALFEFYKRVQLKQVGVLTDNELIERLTQSPQALCIVNTRRHAKGLFDQLESDHAFHLSTLMCPAHRQKTLEEIRWRLTSDQPCTVISTQVLEAGIDIDFPVGYRALAGLDSIIQAAGRVNREGKNTLGTMHIFTPNTPFIKKTPTFILQGASVTESTLRIHPDDTLLPQTIGMYFDLLYNLQTQKTAFDTKKILEKFRITNDRPEFDFKSVAEAFHLIENDTVAIIIAFDEQAITLIAQAKYHPFPNTLSRRLQPYTVNVYKHEFERLQSKGAIETVNDVFQVLITDNKFYHPRTGVVLPDTAGGDAVFMD